MSEETPQKRSLKRKLVFWYGIATCTLILIIFFSWLFFFRIRAFTTDAYVEGNQVYITPLRPGFVTAIHTDDTFLVNKGDLLVSLDRTDSLIGLDRAKEALANAVRDVCGLFHEVFAYQAEIEVKKAELIKAAEDYQHRINVIEEGGVSLENLEHAIAALRASAFSLQRTESLYDKALALIQGTCIRNHPMVLSAQDELRRAFVHLYRCDIRSPVTGLVAQRTIQVGMWANKGQPLMSVIPLDQIWVNANFKETQLKHMRIGQRVRITSDLYGLNTVFPGTIVGLPGAAGNAFSLLPPQNLSGNWIKIVQRLPVRVALDPEPLKTYPLRIGLTMVAMVDLSNQEGLLVPTSEKGSPLYETSIFEIEEKGDLALAEKIIEENLDPSLAIFLETPLGARTKNAADDVPFAIAPIPQKAASENPPEEPTIIPVEEEEEEEAPSEECLRTLLGPAWETLQRFDE